MLAAALAAIVVVALAFYIPARLIGRIAGAITTALTSKRPPK